MHCGRRFNYLSLLKMFIVSITISDAVSEENMEQAFAGCLEDGLHKSLTALLRTYTEEFEDLASQQENADNVLSCLSNVDFINLFISVRI